MDSKIKELQSKIEHLENQIIENNYLKDIPMPPFIDYKSTDPFMLYSTPCVADFMHPRFLEICNSIKHPFTWQRKLWEWVFIINFLEGKGMLKPGNRGLVFGVGSERLPSFFANTGVKIVATDAPSDIGEKQGWKDSNQFADGLSHLYFPDIVDANDFNSNVSYQTCDMNNIQQELNGFDFNWSSCCFEHLGSIDAGLQFVINAVEKTLRIGGVAVHTTEFNLTSNTDTVEDARTVIFRYRDIEQLTKRLNERGHIVKPVLIAPNRSYHDYHVDVPPYKSNVHLKLLLDKYVSTSLGLIITRGR